MLTSTITFAALEAEVRRLVAEQPDFVYPANADGGPIPATDRNGNLIANVSNQCPRCVYTQHADKPPCLWGQALLNLGVPAEDLHDQYTNITHLLENILHIEMTGRDRVWAATMQSGQDAMRPWGVVLYETDKFVNKRYAEGSSVS